MRMLGTLFGFGLVIVIGGFIYLSVSSAHVEQTTITKNIPVTTP